MDSYDVLVIVLSITLTIFLALGITVAIMSIRILNKLKKATRNAQSAVENVEDFTSQLKTAGRATAIGSMVSQIISIFKKGRK